jgi:hypothetical protein
VKLKDQFGGMPEDPKERLSTLGFWLVDEAAIDRFSEDVRIAAYGKATIWEDGSQLSLTPQPARTGRAWPWLLPSTTADRTMPGDYVADLGIVVATAHIAFRKTLERLGA